MSAAVRVLLVEDSVAEAQLTLRELQRAGIGCECRCVQSEVAVREALERFQPEIILSDFTLPGFDGLSALAIAREVAPEVPFVFVSGTLGEERAIAALHEGAVDYVLKDNLARLAPAVRRALQEAQARSQRRQQELQIAHLTRVLRMLGGVNGAVLRIRDRNEIFAECCRLAVNVGGYAACVALLQRPGVREPQVVSSAGADPSAELALQTLAAERISPQVRAEPEVITASDLPSGLCSLVVLPLMLEQTSIGALVLAMREPSPIGSEELRMLQEVAANLSFALQYLRKGNEVQFLSYFDPLTGLAKRPLFCERLKRRIGTSHAASGALASAQTSASFAIGVVDVEKLSIINDSLGRHAGDRLLQHVAERLRRHFHDTECLAQFGGGTFAVALPAHETDVAGTHHLQERLAAVFDSPFELDGRAMPLGVKLGFAVYPADGQDVDRLVQNAEAALRDARVSGQRSQHHTLQQRSRGHARLQLEHSLRLAVERQQFELHYQPIMSLATRRIDGAEALLRWRHPEQGLIAPGSFLPVLESTGMMAAVGEWVIAQAARDRREWQKLGVPVGRIAVNISPTELHQPGFAERFLEHTRGWSSAFCGLDIEITEGALLGDGTAVVAELRRLRDAGICIAIDDFGTGYSSLSRLSELPIDRLKIDRTFVTKLPHDDAGRTLVQTVITLAHAFGMSAVAEGVETSEQLDALVQLGCDRVQGYLISRPTQSEAYLELLQQHSASRVGR